MKIAVVYYSMLGNTQYAVDKAAEILSNQNQVDVIRIEPKKAYPDKGAIKFIWGGKCAFMGEKPTLKPYEFDIDKYDHIIIGTPVWAGTFAPPIRSFIHENSKISKKEISVLVCCSGDGKKAVEKLEKYSGVQALAEELILIDPKEKNKPEDDEKIQQFCQRIMTKIKPC